MALGAAEGVRGASPDRADALVWALTALMLEREREGPRVWVG
jgi:phage terminase large subunit-like protein